MIRLFSRIFSFGIFLLFAVTLHASFFMRLKASSAQTLKSVGGHVVSSAEALVNGAEAKIQVFGFDSPMTEVAAEIRKAWNLPEIDAGRSFAVDGAWITREDGERTDSVLLLPGESSEGCSVWLVEAKTALENTAFSVPGGNPFPSAALKSCIQMKGSGTVLTIHETSAGPTFALRDVEAGMATLGWVPVLQGDTTSYFAKDGHAAAVVAYEADGVTRVSVIRALSR